MKEHELRANSAFGTTNEEKGKTMQTVVVNLNKEPFDVYIGRAGRGQDGYFGNPFRMGAEPAGRMLLGNLEDNLLPVCELLPC
jgi:hypothetical protein